MKTRLLSSVVAALLSFLFASVFDDFTRINTEYLKHGETYFANQTLETYKSGEKKSSIKSYSIYSKNSQFVNIFEVNKETFFLSTNRGYYI